LEIEEVHYTYSALFRVIPMCFFPTYVGTCMLLHHTY